MVGYFVFVVLLLALWVLPTWRASAVHVCGRALAFGKQRINRWQASCHDSLRQGTAVLADSTLQGVAFAARRKWLMTAAGTLLAGPPLIALSLRRWNILEFENAAQPVNEQVAALLRGEQLVPPVPLPPELFLTAEVQAVRPNLQGASRDWNLLDAEFRQRLLLVFQLIRQRHGYELALIEGYRAPDRQNQLVSMQDQIVTHAAAYQSYHQYGLAADCAFLRDGQLIIDERDPWALRGYQLLGEVAAELGLEWGGKWRMRDYGHVELRRPGVLRH